MCCQGYSSLQAIIPCPGEKVGITTDWPRKEGSAGDTDMFLTGPWVSICLSPANGPVYGSAIVDGVGRTVFSLL